MRFFRKKKENPKELLHINLKNGQFSRAENYNSFQTRAESSLKLILEAIMLGVHNKDFEFYLHTVDFPTEKIEKGHFYYCCDQPENLDSVFPDFIFDHWKQAGIPDFKKTVLEISEAAEKQFIHSKMLWIGNVETNPIRKKILEFSVKYPHIIEAYNTAVDQFIIEKKDIPYISLADHTQYKYLIDVEGRGYSGRIKMLLFTKRVLFIQERRWKSYYHFELVPFKHFIPVKNDLSDLLEKINFVENQGENYYQEMAQNAFDFAEENLHYHNAVKRINNLISRL